MPHGGVRAGAGRRYNEWPIERATRLCQLWNDPDLSVRNVAETLQVSMGTVRSQARRLGLGGKAVSLSRLSQASIVSLAKQAAARLGIQPRSIMERLVVMQPLEESGNCSRERALAGREPLRAFHPLAWDVINKGAWPCCSRS